MALRIATRGSALALTQAGMVAEMLGGAELVEVSSDGLPGDKSRFVRVVEQALLDGRADIGVHSAKDLPAEMPEGLTIAAVPAREDPADVWIGVGDSLDDVPESARVGTASAPWPAAGTMRTVGTRKPISLARPRRRSPAAARMIAS